ncbi:MAG: DUF177 domain-containing protein [Pseudomonadota bacterium]
MNKDKSENAKDTPYQKVFDDKKRTSVLYLEIPTDHIPEQGLEISETITAKEKQYLIDTLDLHDISSFQTDIKITKQRQDVFIIKGRVSAHIIQECIVTLEDVRTVVDETLKAKFVPKDSTCFTHRAENIDVDPFEDHDIEAYENGVICLGQFIYETLATAIDPYPRKQDANFDWPGSTPEHANQKNNSNNPFAVLKEFQHELHKNDNKTK